MSTDTPPGEQRELNEFVEAAPRCKAIAERTGEQCLHTPLATLPYCRQHVHLLDDVDLNVGD